MTTAYYNAIPARIEAAVGTNPAGTPGPANVGSINLLGGADFKMTYNVPGPGVRNVSVVPYLIGSNQTTSTMPPADDHQVLLAWQYTPDPGHPTTPPSWRCYKVELITHIFSTNPSPRPTSGLPILDPVNQFNVRTY